MQGYGLNVKNRIKEGKKVNREEALQYIHRASWTGKKASLHRIRNLLEKIDNPQNHLSFVHVAGTNGKGSTSAMLASVLKEAGYCVGLFISPYIHVYNERIQCNGVMITDEELIDILEYIKPFADEMKKQSSEDEPTEFDLNTAIGMEYFKRKKCDIVVLEVGLGGTYDSTNIIENPLVSVITAIGYDHMQVLGSTIEEITKAKAGIIKENSEVVCYGKNKEAEQILKHVCKKKHAKLHSPAYPSLIRQKADLTGQTFTYRKYKDLTIPLLGTYQLDNAAVAIETIRILRKKGFYISNKALGEGLKNTVWIGRFELLSKNPIFIADGSHNAQGIKATAESLRLYFKSEKIVFIIGAMKDKSVSEMTKELIPMAKEFLTVMPPIERAMEAEDLAYMLQQLGQKAKPYKDIKKACAEGINKAGKNGIICAIGSLYMIHDIKRTLEKIKSEPLNS